MSDDVSIVDVRNNLSEEQEKAIISLWQNDGVMLQAEEMQIRLKHIFAIAINQNKQVIGIPTTYQSVDSILKAKLHYIRVFVGKNGRLFHFATDLIAFITEKLNSEFNSDNKEQPIGSAWVVENTEVNKTYTGRFKKIQISFFRI